MSLPDPLSYVPEVIAPWLQGNLGPVILDALKDIINGAEEDLRTFGMSMAQHMVQAVVRGDKEWQGEIGAQAKLLMEIHRIKVAKKNRALVERILLALIQTALKTGVAVAASTIIKVDGESGMALAEGLIKG